MVQELWVQQCQYLISKIRQVCYRPAPQAIHSKGLYTLQPAINMPDEVINGDDFHGVLHHVSNKTMIDIVLHGRPNLRR